MTKNYADTLTISQKAKFSRDFSKAYRGEETFFGSVEYLIVASSAHTLFLPYAIKAFPQAKIAGPKEAEEKIRFINVVEKFDFITDDKDNLKELNLVLDKEGVEIFELEGDAACNAVMCLVDKKGHNHLFL